MTHEPETAMPSPPRISVLINSYNYESYLRPCIDSVLAQDYPNFEVIVVDDGSTDGSRAIIESYGHRIKPILKANGGQASCFNRGFAEADGEILCLLDADDTYLPGKLARLARLYTDPSIDWCFDRVTNDPDLLIPDEVVARRFDIRAALGQGRFSYIPVPTSGLSFRRDLLAQILPMREAKDVVLSDNYLKFATAFLGVGLIVDTPLTFQRLHDSNRYTGITKLSALRFRIMRATGLELAHRYPGLRNVGRELVAGSFASPETPLFRLPAELRAAIAGTALQSESVAALLGLVLKKRLLSLVKRSS